VKAGIASVTACFEAKETGGALLRQILPLAGDAAVAQDGAGGRLRRLGGRLRTDFGTACFLGDSLSNTNDIIGL
jgi:hypothetical protein